ncbi:14006_t:CDS:1, partial [Funneliformis geosporum]
EWKTRLTANYHRLKMIEWLTHIIPLCGADRNEVNEFDNDTKERFKKSFEEINGEANFR